MFDHARSWWQRLAGRGRGAPTERVGDAVGGAERRVSVRFPADGPAAVRSAAGPVAARVRDVSRGGISLAVEHGFAGGTLLTVELPGAVGGAVLAYVLRADPLPEGGWALGCAFAAELGGDALTALGGRRERPAGPDRRAWARSPAVGAARYFPLGEYELTRWADVLDVSPAGVGLAVGERVEPGAVLSLELACGDGPAAHPGPAAVSLLAGVLATSPLEDGRWLLGCSFIRELDEDEFRALRGGDGAE
ncbi:MAG TPA: PilZ domain-containing protein [Gemmataceae bacterium]|jgi:hypothetical protein